jgi:hypothetical protein
LVSASDSDDFVILAKRIVCCIAQLSILRSV